MNINPKASTRKLLYIFVTLGSPIMIYLQNINRIGEAEMSLWLSITAAVSLMARLNVKTNTEEDEL